MPEAINIFYLKLSELRSSTDCSACCPFLLQSLFLTRHVALWICIVFMPIRIRIRIFILLPIRIRISFKAMPISMRILPTPGFDHVGKSHLLGKLDTAKWCWSDRIRIHISGIPRPSWAFLLERSLCYSSKPPRLSLHIWFLSLPGYGYLIQGLRGRYSNKKCTKAAGNIKAVWTVTSVVEWSDLLWIQKLGKVNISSSKLGCSKFS